MIAMTWPQIKLHHPKGTFICLINITQIYVSAADSLLYKCIIVALKETLEECIMNICAETVIFQSGSRSWTSHHCHPWSHTASLAERQKKKWYKLFYKTQTCMLQLMRLWLTSFSLTFHFTVCLAHTSPPFTLSCLGYSSPRRVKDVTGGCLFNESSLEGVMKSTLTPLTTRLISSWDTRQHAAAFCSLAWGSHRPKGQIKDSLNAVDTYVEKLKTVHQSVLWSNAIVFHFAH